MSTQQVKVVQKKPAKQNFKSIFTLGWASSDTVQRMDSGASAISEPTEASPISWMWDSPLVTDKLSAVADMKM